MIIWAALAALLGIGWVQLQPELLPQAVYQLPLALALLVWLLLAGLSRIRSRPWMSLASLGLVARFVRSPVLKTGCACIAVAIACAMLSTWQASRALDQRLPEELDRASVWMQVVVRDLPTRHERGWRLEVLAESAQPDRDDDARLAAFPMRGVVHWYEHGSRFFPQDIRPGERWAFQARLKHPAGALNPGGFDMEAWMLEKGLQFTATVQQGKSAPLPQRLTDRDHWADRLDRLRDDIRRTINEKLADRESRHVIAALVVGDQRAIASSDWRIFQRTGVSHLMSISGLHVTMFAALAALMGALFWKSVCHLSMRTGMLIPVQSVAAAAAIMGAVGYALLAGFAIPAQRTAYMVAVCSGARMLGIRADPWAVIAWALLAIILFDPMAVLAPGFWLSFTAVAFLFSLASVDDDRHAWRWHKRVAATLKDATHAQLGITLALMPMVVMLFQQVSVVGPMANAIAIPTVSYLVTPLAMSGVMESWLFGSSYALDFADQAQSLLATFLRWCAQLRWAVIDWPAPSVASTVMASLGLAIALGNIFQSPNLPDALRSRMRRWRHLGWLGLLFVLGPSPSSPSYGEMHVRVIDVGQGSSILVQTAGHALLFDTGPSMGESDAGERMVMPTLRRLGVRALDRVLISHVDRDHSGGLSSLLALTDVRSLMAPFADELHDLMQEDAARDLHRALPHALNRFPEITECRSGDQWRWDGVHFMVLHPVVPSGRRDRNRDSCVLRIEDRHGGSILLTGDIPIKSERQLVGQFTMLRDPELDSLPHPDGAKLASKVLIAPHHGSKTSTGLVLLAAVEPSLTVISAGYRNRFGHPHAEVLERLASASRTNPQPIALARTDLQGALDIRFENGQPVVRDFFADHRRYWHLRRIPEAAPGLSAPEAATLDGSVSVAAGS